MIAGDQSIHKPSKNKTIHSIQLPNKNPLQQARIKNICHMIKKYEDELDELNTKCESIDVVLKSLQSFFFVKPKTTVEQLDEVHEELTIAHDDMLIEVRQLYRSVQKLDKSIQSLSQHRPTIIPKSNPTTTTSTTTTMTINKKNTKKKNMNMNKKKITKKKTRWNTKNNHQNINRSTKVTNLDPSQQIIQEPSSPFHPWKDDLPSSSSLSSFHSNSSSSSLFLLPPSMNYNMDFNLSIK
ncbi:unnamed protein product [Cunninghamella blakesleeana]